MLTRFVQSLAQPLISSSAALLRCWSWLRSGSLAQELYSELVRKGMSHEEASRIAAESLHDDSIGTGVRARNGRPLTVARSAVPAADESGSSVER